MKNEESGSTIVLSIIVIAVLAMCVAGALDYTVQSLRDAQQSNARNQAVAAATGALDLAFMQWREACRQQENVVLTATAITTSTSVPWTAPSYTYLTGSNAYGGSFMNIKGVSNPVVVTLGAVNATDPNAISNAIAAMSGSGTPIQTPTPSNAQSITLPTYSYLAKATATFQDLLSKSGTNSVSVYRVFKKMTESPWQYAVFYNNDLEVNPGATMNITGSVQTNGNLYTGGSGGANNLTFLGPVNYAKYWDPAGEFDPTDTAANGSTPVPPTPPPTGILPTAGPAQLPQNANLLGSPSSVNGLQDGYHELIEPWPPVTSPGVWSPSSATDPLGATTNPDGTTNPSERTFNQAGVRIMVTGTSRAHPTVNIYDSSGNLCTSSSPAGSTDLAIYNTFTASTANNISVTTHGNTGTATTAITTNASNGTLYDAREGTTVNLTTLDISKITSALTTGGALFGTNCNIIYIDDTYAPSTGPGTNAVEIINGYNVPTNGVTIVSGNPVYIQGDFNTAPTAAAVANVRSNLSSSNPLDPEAPGYTPQSCAIMADAVTILSNNWSNSVTSSMPTPTNTTVNAAILSGNVTSAQAGSGQTFTYSGGVENFPRFLENWSGVYFTYYGSMVELFTSMQGTGVWKTTGNYYNAPHRQWYFNVNYYQTPPPGTFKVISYIKSRWFIQ
jgi:hypothetical protein